MSCEIDESRDESAWCGRCLFAVMSHGAPLRCVILGAAGRDFHDFQTFFARRTDMTVVAFTATQIPFIEERLFPKELAGPRYDADIPIYPEERLPELIRDLDVDLVFLAYSDLSQAEVMQKAAIAGGAGAGFAMLGPKQTQLRSRRPVVSVTAVRTGCGKSPITQAIANDLRDAGRRVGVMRHPMPYGDLRRQVVERFATVEDLDRYACTIEEREEYLPYVERGLVIWAGVDYAKILAAAEEEHDVLLWDGGNNDGSFVRPDVSIVVADPLRSGHERTYVPSEINMRRADVVVVSKVGSAREEDIRAVEASARELAPKAALIRADLEVKVDDPSRVEGRRVLVVEDGPTVTHGGMSHGAAMIAAQRHHATIVDPRPFATGTIAEVFVKYPHLGPVLPALGYSEGQRRELAESIARSDAELVLDGSPAAIATTIPIDKPVVRVRYAFAQRSGPDLFALVRGRVEERLSKDRG